MISLITSRVASKYREENREVQDIYFSQMQDLVGGFKELITGLYTLQSREVIINGEKIQLHELNELLSSVYSDFNIFNKLYGIDYERKKDEINEYLTMMI